MKLKVEFEADNIPWPTHLNVQLDNASDNKSKAHLAFFAHLVEAGLFESVSLNYLLTGHTHEDIDQMFSVISHHFDKLSFSNSSKTVVTFEDFVAEVMNSFRKEKFKPKCVELVELNHDFVSWLQPKQEEKLDNLLQYHVFKFRRQNVDEINLCLKGVDANKDELSEDAQAEKKQQLARFNNSVCLFAKLYMTTDDDDENHTFPSEQTLMDFGPPVMLRNVDHQLVNTDLKREAFIDHHEKKKDKKTGLMKEIPEAWRNLTNEKVFELVKAPWIAWVKNPAYGCEPEQIESFLALMTHKKGKNTQLTC